VEIRDLIQRAELQIRLTDDGAGIRLANCADEFEERRLTGAVCSYQPYFFSGIDLESDIPKHALRTERLRDAIKLYDHV
jgi:hypothetical protein